MATRPHSTATGRPSVDVMVGDDHLGDAIGQIRHSARILTLAILGYNASPHDLRYSLRGHRPYRQDYDWLNDLEALGFDLVEQIDAVDDVLNRGDAS